MDQIRRSSNIHRCMMVNWGSDISAKFTEIADFWGEGGMKARDQIIRRNFGGGEDQAIGSDNSAKFAEFANFRGEGERRQGIR